ncbi:unnamed protein product [Lactuca saligna]|uniref:Uncharacterized protein n=1 Tax=Lactuca saligna TaxID=75948 RepID=A0AA35ZS26_LACSI|nr:unnamed protein product [Lactuca saligna]
MVVFRDSPSTETTRTIDLIMDHEPQRWLTATMALASTLRWNSRMAASTKTKPIISSLIEEDTTDKKKEKRKGNGFWWLLSSAVDDGVPASARWQRRWLVIELVKVAVTDDGDTSRHLLSPTSSRHYQLRPLSTIECPPAALIAGDNKDRWETGNNVAPVTSWLPPFVTFQLSPSLSKPETTGLSPMSLFLLWLRTKTNVRTSFQCGSSLFVLLPSPYASRWLVVFIPRARMHVCAGVCVCVA